MSGQIAIQQITLSNISDRISNAGSGIMIDHYKRRALLFDDAIGLAAKMNEAAWKLKHNNMASEVFGLAVTGSYKGFNVIQEV